MSAWDQFPPEYLEQLDKLAERAIQSGQAAPNPPDRDENPHLTARATYTLAELSEWQYQIPDCKFAAWLPELTSYPNPVLLNDLVIACIACIHDFETFDVNKSKKGQIYALDRETGELRWHLPLPYFGHDLYTAEGYLFGGTSQELLSLAPATGQIRWTFAPYGRRSEYFYASPVSTQGRVYIGDYRGILHCLFADTGQTLWAVQTSNARIRDVNATALLYEDRVIAATLADLAVAYDQVSGREIWRQTLPDCSIHEVRLYEGMALVQTSRSLFGLSPQTGEVLHKWEWPERALSNVCVAEDILCVITDELERQGKKKTRYLSGRYELIGLRQDTELWRLPYPRYTAGGLRWEPSTRLLYEATSRGLGMINPAMGERVAVIEGAGNEEQNYDQIGLPSVEAGALYAISHSGQIARLSPPAN